MLRPWTIDDSDETRPLHDREIARWFDFPAVEPPADEHRPGSSAPTPSGPTGPRSPTSCSGAGGPPAPSTSACRTPVSASCPGRSSPPTADRVSRGGPCACSSSGPSTPSTSSASRRTSTPTTGASVRTALRAGLRREGRLRGNATLAGVARTPSCSGGAATTHTRTPVRASRRCSTRPSRPSAPSPRACCARHWQLLLCELVYKREWDLPGGVVDRHESPAACVVREVREELDLGVTAGPLLAVNWLPALHGWGDADGLRLRPRHRRPPPSSSGRTCSSARSSASTGPAPATGRGGSPPTTSGCSTRCTRHDGGTLYLEDGTPTL